MRIRITILLTLCLASMFYSGMIYRLPANELYFLTLTNSAAGIIAQIISACCALGAFMQFFLSAHK